MNLIGHHGTNRSKGQMILRDGFAIGRDEDLRLGIGVYFWENDKTRALEWCRERRHRNYLIIKSDIEFSEQRFLDLTKRDHKELLDKAMSMIDRMSEYTKYRNLKFQQGMAINILYEKIIQFDVVRGVDIRTCQNYRSKKSFFPNVSLYFSVRNIDCIKTRLLVDEGSLMV